MFRKFHVLPSIGFMTISAPSVIQGRVCRVFQHVVAMPSRNWYKKNTIPIVTEFLDVVSDFNLVDWVAQSSPFCWHHRRDQLYYTHLGCETDVLKHFFLLAMLSTSKAAEITRADKSEASSTTVAQNLRFPKFRKALSSLILCSHSTFYLTNTQAYLNEGI